MLDSTRVLVTRPRRIGASALPPAAASSLVLMRCGPAGSGARCQQLPERPAGRGGFTQNPRDLRVDVDDRVIAHGASRADLTMSALVQQDRHDRGWRPRAKLAPGPEQSRRTPRF